MYDDRVKSETKNERKQVATTTSILNYATLPFSMFEKYENRSDIESNEVKLVLKKCIETPIVQDNQGCMHVSILILLLYLRE
jgi:hypothetical protein